MTIEVIANLDDLINLLEANIPANPASSKNESIEKGLQKSLSEYFRDLDNALDWNRLEQLYYKNVKQD